MASSTLDLLYFIGAICLLWITGFLCWTLYEIARLVRQANEVMDDTRHKIERFESAVVAIGEMAKTFFHSLSALSSWMKEKKGKGKK